MLLKDWIKRIINWIIIKIKKWINLKRIRKTSERIVIIRKFEIDLRIRKFKYDWSLI